MILSFSESALSLSGRVGIEGVSPVIDSWAVDDDAREDDVERTAVS